MKDTPHASNSRSYQPAATPSINRPPDIRSRLAVVFASTTGFRSGSTKIPVPNDIRLVTVEIAASVDRDSRNGKGDLVPSRMWSQTHSESNPICSILTP